MDIEAIVEPMAVSDADKIKKFLYYLPRDVAEFCVTLREYKAVPANYEEFKLAVLKAYPGSTPAEKWALGDLESFVSAQRGRRITTRGDFVDFH